MLIDLYNALATFRSLLTSTFLVRLDDFVVVYSNDIPVFSKIRRQHWKDPRLVLSRLEERDLYVEKDKHENMKEKTEVLGLKSNSASVSTKDDGRRRVFEWPKPQCISEVPSVVGLLQFFRRLMEDFLKMAKPLTELTKKSVGIQERDLLCDTALDTLKWSLTQTPTL